MIDKAEQRRREQSWDELLARLDSERREWRARVRRGGSQNPPMPITRYNQVGRLVVREVSED